MTPGEFVGMLLHGVTQAHMLHLLSRNYAEHMALGELYEGLGEHADEIAEVYQGAYNLITDYPDSFPAPDRDAGAWLTGFAQGIEEGRKDMPQDSEIQNLIDEVVALVERTFYKLRFLGGPSELPK